MPGPPTPKAQKLELCTISAFAHSSASDAISHSLAGFPLYGTTWNGASRMSVVAHFWDASAGEFIPEFGV